MTSTPVHSPPSVPALPGGENHPALPETLIEPRGRWRWLPIAELWAYRDLFVMLVLRDVRVRYKQTALGVAWAVLQPLALMGLFALFLGRTAAGPTADGLPYPLFAYAGLTAWFLFATAVSAAGNSLIDSERLLTKVYFPRLLIPLGAAAVAVVDYLVAAVVLAGLMAWYGRWPGWGFLLVLPAVGMIFVTAVGVGSLLAAVNVKYRDFRHALPFLVQAWLFATPTVYLSLDAAGAGPPDWVRTVAHLNPVTGLVAFARAALLDRPLPWAEFGVGAALGAALFAVGTAYFARVEDEFADTI